MQTPKYLSSCPALKKISFTIFSKYLFFRPYHWNIEASEILFSWTSGMTRGFQLILIHLESMNFSQNWNVANLYGCWWAACVGNCQAISRFKSFLYYQKNKYNLVMKYSIGTWSCLKQKVSVPFVGLRQ